MPYTYEFLRSHPEIVDNNEEFELTCCQCGSAYVRDQRVVKWGLKTFAQNFCSLTCSAGYKNRGKSQIVGCAQCQKQFRKMLNQINKSKSGNHFCCKSCAATYNNTHKKTGTRRSKLEVWLEEHLPSLYPDLKIQFNNKEIINSELDIYIPSLKLAFELNGIFHYEPIYGKEKLAQIQNNDQRKFQACLEKDIELCIVDSSQMKHFTAKKAQMFLQIITSIIDTKISGMSDLNGD